MYMTSFLNCMEVTVDFIQDKRLLLTHYSGYYSKMLIVVIGVII
jgi:hypothetical protein